MTREATVVDALDALTPGWRDVERRAGEYVNGQTYTGDETPPPKELTWRTGDEIAAATPEHVPYVSWPYIPQSVVIDLTAKIKGGKTTLMLNLVHAVTNGGQFLGETVKMSGPVVLLTEQGPNSFQDQLKRSQIDSPNLHVLYRHEARGMAWEQVTEAAVQKALEVKAVLLVVDTLSGWVGFDETGENDSGASTTAMMPLMNAAAMGLTVLINRHDRKSGGAIGESGRGSGAIGGAADVLLHLVHANTEGHENRRVLECVGRFDDAPAKVTLEWNGSEYVVLGNAADIERNEARLLIPDILPLADGEPMKTGDVVEKVRDRVGSIGKSTVERALKELAESGDIELVEGLGKNKRGHGYRLNQFNDSPKGIDPESSNLYHVPNRDVRDRDESGVRGVNQCDESAPIPLGESSNHPSAKQEERI